MDPTHWVTDIELEEAAARAAAGFDKRMEEAIANEDDVGAVLRSHLLIERTLIEFLKERFTNPDVLDKGLSPKSDMNGLLSLVGIGDRSMDGAAAQESWRTS